LLPGAFLLPLAIRRRMSEYRYDLLHNRWVIVGGQRAGRPHEYEEQVVRRSVDPCPFCAGSEHQTPAALAVYHRPQTSGWSVRVVPNKYPAVEPSPAANGVASHGLFASRPALGQHEVIIESPRHVASLSELTDDECALVFEAYRDRLQALQDDGQFRYVQIFKNVGAAAGASIEHSHSQLLALPHVPLHVTDELENCRRYRQEHGRPLLAALTEEELARGERIVAESAGLVAFCPWASRFPYETWIVPRRQQPSFTSVSDGEIGEVARIVQDLIGRIERALGPVGYNFLLHSQPFDTSSYDHYHWHIELFPRITKVAGFEWSTGVFINTTPPEAAADELRAAARAAGKNLAAVPSGKTG
jgi:UDPglucose--hexose-1-phosphate uridylyltransferase